MNRLPGTVPFNLRMPRELLDAYRKRLPDDSTAVAALMRKHLAEGLEADRDAVALWVSDDVFALVVRNFGEDYSERLDKLLRFYFADVEAL